MTLTNPQKATLAQLAREAFKQQTTEGKTAGFSLDDFRGVVVHQVTMGRADGLRRADRADYLAIRGAFLTLAGRDVDAFENAMDESTQRRKQILWCIDQTAKKAGFGPAYILAVVADRFDRGVTWRDDLTEAELLNLSITLAARALARRKKAACDKATPIPAGSL